MKHYLVFFLFLGVMGNGISQFNKYKYIVVPKKFEVFKNANEHSTSTLIKHLLTERGLPVVYDDAQPKDLLENKCLGAMVDIDNNSTMFRTKMVLVFSDCYGKEIYKTIEGSTKEKVIKKAYHEVIRQALHSIDGRKYEYKENAESEETEPIKVNFKNDVKNLEDLKKANTTIASESKRRALSFIPEATSSGYQLINESNEISYMLLRTSFPDIYIVSTEKKKGIAYKKDGKWFIEFNEEGSLDIQEVTIQF